MKKIYWIRRDEDGTVTAALNELAFHDEGLLASLKDMASVGPIERIYSDYVRLGMTLDENPDRPRSRLDNKKPVRPVTFKIKLPV